MWALVLSAGDLLSSSRVTATSWLNPGYEVDFDRDVSNCAYEATPVSDAIDVLAQPRNNTSNGVFVSVTSPAGTPTQGAFYLTVTC
jgi:hypothetical protein